MYPCSFHRRKEYRDLFSVSILQRSLGKGILLTTSDDEHITAKLRGLAHWSTKVEQLAQSSRLAVLGSVV